MKFEKSTTKLDYLAFGVFINKNVAIYDTNKRTIVTFLFGNRCLNITIVKSLLKEDV